MNDRRTTQILNVANNLGGKQYHTHTPAQLIK